MSTPLMRLIQDEDFSLIPLIKQYVSENKDTLALGDKIALTNSVKEYNKKIGEGKKFYFKIIEILLPYYTDIIRTSDYKLASYVLEQGKKLVYSGVLKPELFFPPAPIPGNYAFIGHGSDTGRTISVPHGCTYVAVTLCGDISDASLKIPNFMTAKKDKLIEYAMEGNHRAMSRELRFPCTIYKEGEEITETIFHLPAVYKVILTDPDSYPDISYPDFILPGGLMPIEDVTYKKLEESPHLLRDSYANSVFPSLPILESLGVEIMTKDDLRKYPIKVSLSHLFEHYPGIHFMIICRVHEPGQIESVKLRRKKSFTSRHAFTLEELKTMDKDTLLETLNSPYYFIEETKGDIKEYLSSIEIDLRTVDVRDKIVMRGGKRTRRKRSRFQ